jgi:hypothetical protein
VQLIEPRRKEQLLHTGVDTVMCLEEMKMQLLGAASNCLGVNTLIDNLLNSFTRPKSTSRPWQAEYTQGCCAESFAVPYPSEILGPQVWTQLLLTIYNVSRGRATVIGVIVDGQQTTHPGCEYVVHRGATLLIVAEDRDTAFMVVRPANHRKSQILAVEAVVECEPVRPLCPLAPGHDVPNDGGIDPAERPSRSVPLPPPLFTARVSDVDDGVPPTLATPTTSRAAKCRGLRVLYDARPYQMRGHVIVCGSMSNVELLLRSVRNTEFDGTVLHKPVVLLHPVTESEQRSLETRLADFVDVFLVCGEPKKHSDLERVAIETASCCILLADREDLVEVDTDALSIKTIFTYLSIEKYVLQTHARSLCPLFPAASLSLSFSPIAFSCAPTPAFSPLLTYPRLALPLAPGLWRACSRSTASGRCSTSLSSLSSLPRRRCASSIQSDCNARARNSSSTPISSPSRVAPAAHRLRASSANWPSPTPRSSIHWRGAK